MWAEDVRPNRLERQRLEARRLVTELAGHRVGLVAFAGAAYLLSPLTVDHAAIHLYLDALDPTTAGTPGSALSDAIQRAVGALGSQEDESGDRAIVVLTDGESHDASEDVIAAARAASAAGIRIYGIGIGGEAGEPIPRHDRTGARVGGFKHDDEGRVVLTRLSREPLATAAQSAGGFFARADENGAARVLTALAELRAGRAQATRGVRWTPRFQWFVALALLLVMIDAVWAGRSPL
jgi:Ca-activated chloride channel family protein